MTLRRLVPLAALLAIGLPPASAAQSVVDAGGALASQVIELSAPPADWQALKGKQVRIVAPLTVSGTDQAERYGELTTAFGGRLWQPGELAAPGSEAFKQLVKDNAKRRLVLDDGSNERDPKTISWLGDQALPGVATSLGCQRRPSKATVSSPKRSA